ncbi:class I SAM-dependent methyltransferase [Roseomonas genomospecies 6]|uniref:Methyltransferase domain-containing protein n=1 Tax=Roseomonas genomospecies 6 TaxID=214106 RepID=A0A9W7KRV4_9PROT|nr:class I SAM-dependent methyltransferase [Roseomonas genomospecies 6]KAA0678248.1 methyltransferase domain-containing protein [Roseomonas genomospecies 6]
MAGSIPEITSCEVCGNTRLEAAIDLGLHPMCDDLVKVGDGRICREYPIDILFCDVCRTAHQRFQVPKRELFPQDYHYRSRFTADVLRGMEQLAQSVEQELGSLKGLKVLDIGCNDGSLLGMFQAHGASTIGIEPTGAAQDAIERGHAVYNDYLGDAVAERIVAEHGKPDIITFTNVFAHIENLGEVIGSLKLLMKPETLLVIENHYLGAVLDGNQFDTFYHEHPRTYSMTSFEHIARSLGVVVAKAEFVVRYGGNIRVFMRAAPLPGTANASNLDEVRQREAGFGARFEQMRANVLNWQTRKKREIEALVKEHGPLYGKAFPGRAAILVKLLGLDETVIAGVFEKPGSLKIGHYLPGTRIPILSDDDLFAMAKQPPVLVNFAWHIPAEIHGYLKNNGFSGTVVDIISADDFKTVD